MSGKIWKSRSVTFPYNESQRCPHASYNYAPTVIN